MTIRAKLTFWYAGILFLSTLLVGGASYYRLASESQPAVHPQISEEEESDLEEEMEEWREAIRPVLWIGLPAALLALGGGWLLMRQALAPVAALTAAADRIHSGNLRQQLPRTGNGDELDRLTAVFNTMISRLNHAFQRIREFTLNASHELKTPLTVLHAELETALREEQLLPPQQERLLSQLDEIQRLATIVDGLTLLTKADAGQVELRREPVSLDELVREAFEDAQILAQPTRVKVELSRCDAVTLPGDRHRLRQLLLNLTDNAVKHNQSHGRVVIELERTNDTAHVRIANTGPGLSRELNGRVFDRFFRGDSAHGNALEGSGLGLSIAQWIVQAHGGELEFESAPNDLTRVTVHLPLTPPRRR